MRLKTVIDNHLTMTRTKPADFAREIGWSQSKVTRWLNGSDVTATDMANLISWLLHAGEAVEEEEPDSADRQLL